MAQHVSCSALYYCTRAAVLQCAPKHRTDVDMKYAMKAQTPLLCKTKHTSRYSDSSMRLSEGGRLYCSRKLSLT
eukprot:15831-Heterococcus_DN1.PRE.2